jgi:hypothetical protein
MTASDTPTNTSRFSFQGIGGTQTLEPDAYNKVLNKIDSNLPADASVTAALLTSFATGAAFTSSVPGSTIQRLRVTLTAVRVTITDASAYGSVALFTWPNTNLTLINSRFNLVATKDGTGVTAALTPAVALGSAAASNATLSSTMIDTVDTVTLAGTIAAAAQKNGPATHALRQIVAGASNKVFLNAAVNPAADGYIDFSGTADFDFIDLGNYS